MWGMMKELSELTDRLKRASSVEEKISQLDPFPLVQELIRSPLYLSLSCSLSPEFELIIKQLAAIGQWDRLISGTTERGLVLELLQKLSAVELFYSELGGIVGYQSKILEFLNKRSGDNPSLGIAYHPPSFIHIEEENEFVDDAILSGIETLENMAEIYPLGGAADRLHLIDEKTQEELPAANLLYLGRSLLEGLVRDLQAREYLYFKLFGKQAATPIAMMTSREKNNHDHLLKICEKQGWFGRSRESFRFFVQPLVPAVDSQGDWCVLAPLTPLLKPGGHGVIWKLARDSGTFQWLKGQGRTKALVRQINNPITSLDYGLLAFMGVGIRRNMTFGFASCPRLVQSAEGVNVVIEKEDGQIVLTNIEYCDFEKFGIQDLPLKEGEPYSRFSSNTNILFVDLEEVSRAVDRTPFPGLLINLKKTVIAMLSGEKKESVIARLESTMQNIADVFTEKKGDSFATQKTFVTYNHRHKTISTVKKALSLGSSFEETPENCFYVQMKAARELLEKHCQFHLPPSRSLSEYLDKGPDLVFLYHPALGPLYSILRQKISKGKISAQSEMQLEIADLEIRHLNLSGSLIIHAEQPIGHFAPDGILHYSNQTGRCRLRNVTICNQGVDWGSSRPFWRNQLCRKESFRIELRGHSEFIAEDVIFEGSHQFIVADGTRMRVRQEGKEMIAETTSLADLRFWDYKIDERRIELAAHSSF